MSGGFLIDSHTLRERARRFDARLSQDAQIHHGKPTESEHRWARQQQRLEDSMPAPVFTTPAQYQDEVDFDDGANAYALRARTASSVARRAARFRDGLPPPPPPPRAYDATDYAPRREVPLLDQEALNRGQRRPLRREAPASASPQYPQHSAPQYGQPTQPGAGVVYGQPGPPPPSLVEPAYAAPPGYMLVPADVLEAQSYPQQAPAPQPYPQQAPMQHALPAPKLSASQKKRARKRRAREGYAPTPQAPAPHTNGVHPTPGVPTQPHECPSETMAVHPRAGALRLKCTLSPWPHPNQPHMMQLAHPDDANMSIFVGWWMPGE
jgi:hypothetical protein